MKEHNRKCDEIRTQEPKYTDEQIFQAARHYVMGLIQKITFDDFLPEMLGRNNFQRFIGQYPGYNPNINPAIPLEFATGAFRVGHSMLVSDHPIINQRGQTTENLKLQNLFLAPQTFKRLEIGDIFRGISSTLNKERNHQIVGDVRNFLIQNGPGQANFFFDLFALNVQRGRDHGLPFYNEARKQFGLQPYSSFYEFTRNADLAQRLERVYNNINQM